MELAIGTFKGRKGDNSLMEVEQCTSPELNGMHWLSTVALNEATEFNKPFLIKFDPQDQFCQIVSLDAIKDKI